VTLNPLKNLGLFLGVFKALFLKTSVKVVMPVVGQELMPPRDTGGVMLR